MDFDDIFVSDSDRTIGHLGLVAGSYDELNIGQIIDHLIPKKGPHHLTHGDIVKTMVINGLGYIERRLYLFPAFFTDISLTRLFNKEITPTQLNDDVLGRTFDAIHAFGETEIFNHIVSECLERDQFAVNLVNNDTTNFSVYGNYDSYSNTEEIEITHGHPKDGRWDLKRFALGMVTNQHGIPLLLQTFSGNESDKKALLEIITKVKNNLNVAEKVIHVADSAFYTEENLQTLGLHTFWISRVHLTISEAESLRKISEPFTPCEDSRYSYNFTELEKEKSILGRFIIATKDPDLDPETALNYYKGQSQVEKGFRFLKDKIFRVSEVFLKNTGRIQALAMIMVLCLYVYAVTEYKLRKSLKETNKTVPSQTGKPTQKPTLRWIFFLFRRVRELSLRIEGRIITKVLNLDETIQKIIRLLGTHHEKYYFI